MRVSGHKIESLFHEIIAYPEKRRGILEGLEAGERLQLEKWLEFDAKAESGRLFEPLKTLDVSESARGSLPSRIGNYRIEGLLGEGGMGVVYKALHIHLKTYVALKVLPAKRLLSESAVKRFELEMAAVGLLSHPNLVHATDAGNDENQYYIALEFVDGTDAAQIVRPDGKLSISNACDLVRQAALGLAHAHDNGLIHRDVKPSNLLVSATGVVKVADMGLAQLQNQSDAGLTESGQIMGTLDYISPEQIEKPAQANASSDLYSLGCTLYQLLSGKPPFSKPEFETPLQKMRAHDQQTPVALVDSAEGIPKELSELTNELLTKNPVDRLSSGEELARRLEPYCQDADLGGLVKRVARSREHELSTDRIRFEKLETQVLLPSSRGSSKTKIVRGVLWAVACVFVALAAWNAQALIRIATNKGVLVVENFDGVDVSIVQGERPLVIRDKVTKREYSLGVGDDYRILIRETGTGVEYTSEQFSITRNQETVFDVRAELASRLATDVADLNNPSANAMSSNGARTEADLSVSRDANLDFLRWGFGHGVFRFQAYDNVGRWFDVSNLKKLPSGNLSRLRSARLFVRNLESDPKRIEEILTKVPDSIDVDVLHLEGSAPSKPALEAISSNAALRNVRFYGCFDFDALEKMPVGCFKYVEILLLWEVMLSEDLKSIASHFPNLKKLNVCELPAQGVDVLLDLPLEFLVLNVDEYSEAQPELNDLSILTNIRELVLAFSSKLTQEPVTDFEKLPPNLSSLELHNFSLTAENFDQLQRYAQLESVKTEYSAHASRSPPAIDQQLVESFQQRRSDVFLDLYDPSGASMPSSADASPVHAVAAFDNGKGFSYVFYSNGLYDKVINATDQVYHQLETEYFWSHSVEHRSPLMLAALTQGKKQSFVFFSDGQFSTHHSPSNIGLAIEPIDSKWSGKLRKDMSAVRAAIEWADGSSYFFFVDGTCSKLDDEYQEISTGPTKEYFPNLSKRASQVSAARRDPLTNLAYFYFESGEFQVFDCETSEVLGTFVVGRSNWTIPLAVENRALPFPESRPTGQEIVRWVFDHGVTEVFARPAGGARVVLERASDYRDRNVIGGRINCDEEQAPRALFSLARMGDPFPRQAFSEVTLVGEDPLSEEFVRRLDLRGLRKLAIHCPVDATQLFDLAVARQIRELSLSAPSQEAIQVVANSFKLLRVLELQAEGLRAPDLIPLSRRSGLRTLKLVSANFTEQDLAPLVEALPDLEIQFQ